MRLGGQKSKSIKNINKSYERMKLDRQKSKSDSEKTTESTGDVNASLERMREALKNGKKDIGRGLKIMTPNQLLTRLPILLAQKQAGNNSQKLNNEIRQIIHSLYSSKNLSKAVYNNLMKST